MREMIDPAVSRQTLVGSKGGSPTRRSERDGSGLDGGGGTPGWG
jgi:hypothetical protein